MPVVRRMTETIGRAEATRRGKLNEAVVFLAALEQDVDGRSPLPPLGLGPGGATPHRRLVTDSRCRD